MIITVDCGTTNMRLRLYDNRSVTGEVKRKAGGRNTAFTGSSDYLKGELKTAIQDLLSETKTREDDIEIILCSGILASDVGIYYIPHAIAPCGVTETARQAKKLSFSEITKIPILLIPGIKSIPDDSDTTRDAVLDKLESMSGEECEAYGIMDALGITGDFVISLPGSYNKAFCVNEKGQIHKMVTGMCGEMIAAMSEHTLLKKTLPSPVLREIIPEKLCEGFDYAKKNGMSPSLIKARTIYTMDGATLDEAANFFIGCILVDDIMSSAKLSQTGKKFVVGGSSPLRDVFAILLDHVGVCEIITVSDDIGRRSPNLGAMKVYERFKELSK